MRRLAGAEGVVAAEEDEAGGSGGGASTDAEEVDGACGCDDVAAIE